MKQSADSGIVSPNFWFLEQHDPALLQAAVSAERYVFSDPNSALVKLRQLAEFFARGVASGIQVKTFRGKLVPKTRATEPASELLARTAREQERKQIAKTLARKSTV